MRIVALLTLSLVLSCARHLGPAPTAVAVGPTATERPDDPQAILPAMPIASIALPLSPPDPIPVVEVVELPVAKDLAIYPLRGAIRHERKAVMLAGLCSNPAWYLNAFPNAAAAYGEFVGLQGDVVCRGAATKWSTNSPLLEHRMARAFDEAGMGELTDVTVVGYSQGAERSEWLAAYDPVRFTRFILIGGPIVPSPERFAHAHAVVLMAGSLDLQTLMREGAERLTKAGIPATFMVLPGARHGEMGSAAEEVMGRAFDWLDANDKTKKSTIARVTREPAEAIAR